MLSIWFIQKLSCLVKNDSNTTFRILVPTTASQLCPVSIHITLSRTALLPQGLISLDIISHKLRKQKQKNPGNFRLL